MNILYLFILYEVIIDPKTSEMKAKNFKAHLQGKKKTKFENIVSRQGRNKKSSKMLQGKIKSFSQNISLKTPRIPLKPLKPLKLTFFPSFNDLFHFPSLLHSAIPKYSRLLIISEFLTFNKRTLHNNFFSNSSLYFRIMTDVTTNLLKGENTSNYSLSTLL